MVQMILTKEQWGGGGVIINFLSTEKESSFLAVLWSGKSCPLYDDERYHLHLENYNGTYKELSSLTQMDSQVWRPRGGAESSQH